MEESFVFRGVGDVDEDDRLAYKEQDFDLVKNLKAKQNEQE